MTHVHVVQERNIKNVAEKMHKVLYRLKNKYIIIFERNINCSKDINNTLKSTVSILKAAEREALDDDTNLSQKSGESSPVDDIPNTSLEWLQ